MRTLIFALFLAAALGANGCNRSAPASAEQPANASNSPANAAASDTAALDAEIAQLEAQAEKNPDDKAARDAVADAYVRRGDAYRAGGKLKEAMEDYQSAISLNPAHEDAQLKLAQLQQELGEELKTDDGKPVSVPAKPEGNSDR